MDDNTNSLKSLMETILSRLDEQKLDNDKRLEAQVAFNTQVSQDLRTLSKQVNLIQADIDETRKALERSPSPQGSGSATVINPPPPPLPLRPAPVPQLQQQGPPPSSRLTDQRPPLLATAPPFGLPIQPAPLHTPYHQTAESPHHQHQPSDNYIKPPKHDFPRFDGSAPYLWLDRSPGI